MKGPDDLNFALKWRPILQTAEEVKAKADAQVAKAESRAMALQQQLVLLQLSLQEQGQLIRESSHNETSLEAQLSEIRLELKVTESRENELRALAAELEVRHLTVPEQNIMPLSVVCKAWSP